MNEFNLRKIEIWLYFDFMSNFEFTLKIWWPNLSFTKSDFLNLTLYLDFTLQLLLTNNIVKSRFYCKCRLNDILKWIKMELQHIPKLMLQKVVFLAYGMTIVPILTPSKKIQYVWNILLNFPWRNVL